jgi:glycosyltransferase involved in cell wall biosynthesis
MKVLFPLVAADSGSDIFTATLASGLTKMSIPAEIHHVPAFTGYFPEFAGFFTETSGYDIIHANLWNGFAFRCDLPLVSTEYHVVHDPLFAPYTSHTQRLFYRRLFTHERKSLGLSDKVTVISRYTRKKLEEVFGYSDSALIYCGIDTSLFAPLQVDRAAWGIDEGKTILLYVGNHLRRKGADLLAPIMKNLGDDYLLLTAGLRSGQKDQAGNIRDLGRVGIHDLVRAYNLCDMLLFPSRLEGFGLTVAEAMACAKPVVTTNASSLPELIELDKGGILCDLDDVAGFADAVRYLADDEDLRGTMGSYNLNRVKGEFDQQRMIQQYISLYRRIL